ncbi:MAG: hypothetical protein ROY99_05360 [Ignavibacterium sp.]|jgi:hypothetical protein|nr:hypothetical protein [Ignavibacterium sp.]
MKQGLLYGGTFVFVFVIVTGLLIYLNSSYENIFQFNFGPKQEAQLKDSTFTTQTEPVEDEIPEDSSAVKDSVLLSGIGEVEKIDSVNTGLKTDSENILSKNANENRAVNNDKGQNYSVTGPLGQSNENPQTNKDFSNSTEYKDWIQKVTRIYSALEPKKAAKIIQTYSDNVARDILYNMNKKTAAKVVSEFSPETANRIFRFE